MIGTFFNDSFEMRKVIIEDYSSNPKEIIKLSDFEYQKTIVQTRHSKIELRKSKNNSSLYIVVKKLLYPNNDENSKNEIIRIKTIVTKELINHNNPNFINVLGQEEINGNIYYFLEYCKKGDLSTFIEDYKKKHIPINQEIIINISSQISNGLKYLHSKKIIHRNILPQNILLDGDLNNSNDLQVKILGFRLFAYYDDNVCQDNILFPNNKRVGSPIYGAPEKIDKFDYDYSSDIFSFGVVMFELMTFDLPFYTFYNRENQKYIRTPSEIKIDDKFYHRNLITLVDKMIDTNPKNRPTANEVFDKLQIIFQ